MAICGPEFLDVFAVEDASGGHSRLSGLPLVQILHLFQFGTLKPRSERFLDSVASPVCSSTGLRILPVRSVGEKVHKAGNLASHFVSGEERLVST